MLRLHALGVAVDVDLAGSELDEDEFRRLWNRCLGPAVAGGRAGGAEPPVVRVERPTSFESLTQRITKELIEQRWGELLMLHAGAVTDPSSGRTLAYVGPGGTGKSTLTRLLAQQLGYVTDETVGIVPGTLAVLPYPKPITWAPVAGERKREHSPESLGLQPTPERPHLARLVVLRRTDGAPATFTQLGPLDALRMVVPETSSLSKLPRPLELLGDVFRRVGGVTLIEYGEAADIVDWCVESLKGPANPPTSTQGTPDAEASPGPAATGPGEGEGEGEAEPGPSEGEALVGQVTRGRTFGFVVVDGESVVLLENELLGLGPVATRIVQALDEPRTVAELAEVLEAEFGAPADVDLLAAVEGQLETLAKHAVVSR